MTAKQKIQLQNDTKKSQRVIKLGVSRFELYFAQYLGCWKYVFLDYSGELTLPPSEQHRYGSKNMYFCLIAVQNELLISVCFSGVYLLTL